METRREDIGWGETGHPEGKGPGKRGLWPWMKRNYSLLSRLFFVLVLTLSASLVVSNFIYGLHKEPKVLTARELRSGHLPQNVHPGDYVAVRGTPDYGSHFKTYGTPASKIAVSSRYEVSYFYFRLKETGNHLLIQTSKGAPGTLAQGVPDVSERGTRVWKGKLSTVGSVIFPSTTQAALEQAHLPRDRSIPVVETGETPAYYRRIFPTYSIIFAVWALSVVWLLWRRNTPLVRH
ncbi:MAG: hypothetical protein IRY88_14805 [Rubrobacteraceae bacterium]|uniref:hypothetical protein n=1 Tax=Rubrobacter calidifluminis TaxID=1392640 RepID=UPI00235DC5ED|nr:hypothetical protein [Rubrobacter calidifluminis]MBX6764925.1 hypothetical protein [Rubrobacteraceae bacterium]